ncbi:MAG: GNAT family N-acetyltransferase [Roseibium sp.]|nr:GNAT family N-acetyltransferase [Roseibium sp.]
MLPKLESDTLVLRVPESGDFDAYSRFFADPAASGGYGGPLRPDRAWQILAGHIGHWCLRGYGMWMVVNRDTGEVLGGCGFVWPKGWPRRELTWWLLPDARGRGIATCASRLAIRHAYMDYAWDQVETHMNDDNIAARALVDRLGGIWIARQMFPDGLERNVFRLPHPDRS